VRVSAIELALSKGGLIAKPLNLLLLRVAQGSFGLQMGLARFGQRIDFRWCHRLQECRCNLCVDRCGAQVLTFRSAALDFEMIADILTAALVTHSHLVSAFAAI